jgi:hypothetical protein
MGDIVSQSGIFIDYSGGNKKLRRVKSIDISDDSDIEVVKAVGVRGGAGVREQEGGGSITFEVYRETGAAPEVDYQLLKDSKEWFAITVRDEDGQAEQFQQCRVAQNGRKGDDSGSHMQSVKIVFLQRVPL